MPGSTLRRALNQSFSLPAPTITEKTAPDQTGRIHIVTGGYAGCGQQLATILYGLNATVFVAGRSPSKAEAAIKTIKESAPSSKGAVAFLEVDLADLSSIAPAVATFEKHELSRNGTLHVLTNNAGVMFPPNNPVSAQKLELQVATNCVGPYLLTKLLVPSLARGVADDKSAGRPAGGVRVTWAGSLGIDLISPKGGVVFESDAPGADVKAIGRQKDYGVSKAGNLFLAKEAARRGTLGGKEGVLHYVSPLEVLKMGEDDELTQGQCWNPGNLYTELQRHVPGGGGSRIEEFLSVSLESLLIAIVSSVVSLSIHTHTPLALSDHPPSILKTKIHGYHREQD